MHHAVSSHKFALTRLFGSLSLLLALAVISFLVPEPAQSADVIKSGTLSGRSDHITTGTVTIRKDGDKLIVELGEDFSLDGAPSPTLAFTKGGKFDKSTEFAELKKLTGKQTYELPASIAVNSYDGFVVWCSKFAVPLGAANLN
ncbi:MAG: DM13 domain-containing protein [Pseudomonadota bacterium]